MICQKSHMDYNVACIPIQLFFYNIIRDALLIRCLFLLSITVGNSEQGLG